MNFTAILESIGPIIEPELDKFSSVLQKLAEEHKIDKPNHELHFMISAGKSASGEAKTILIMVESWLHENEPGVKCVKILKNTETAEPLNFDTKNLFKFFRGGK